MFPFPTPCKGKSKSQPFAHTFALTGRRRLCIDTQGVALGCGLVGLSARAGPQTRLLPHNLHQLNISILNTLAARGIARTVGEGLRRSTVAHFARKVRGDEYCGGQTRLKIQRRYALKRWLYSLRVIRQAKKKSATRGRDSFYSRPQFALLAAAVRATLGRK